MGRRDAKKIMIDYFLESVPILLTHFRLSVCNIKPQAGGRGIGNETKVHYFFLRQEYFLWRIIATNLTFLCTRFKHPIIDLKMKKVLIIIIML